MTMQNVFHPGARKWISELYIVGEMTANVRNREDGFMAPIRNIPNCDEIRKIKEQLQLAAMTEDSNLKAIKARLFATKKGGKKAKPAPEEHNSELDDEDTDTTTEQDEEEQSQSYSDKSNAESDAELNGNDEMVVSTVAEVDNNDGVLCKRSWKRGDDVYMFDSDSDLSEATGGDQELGPRESTFNMEDAAVVSTSAAPTVGAAPEVPLPPDTSEQDKKDFKNYFEYVRRHSVRTSKRNMERTREEMIILLKNEKSVPRVVAKAQFNDMAERLTPQLAFSTSEVIVEDPLVRGSAMPMLAGPIPNEVLQAQGALALYAGLSDEPGNFQWRMGHVVDILSTQLRGNLRLLREGNIESPEERKREFGALEGIATVSIYQPVEEVDDILVEMRTIPEPEFGFEVDILTTQTVEDLCQMFRCQTDLVYTTQFQDPDVLPAMNSKAIDSFGDKLSKRVFPWKAIFIYDTIYVNFDLTATRDAAKYAGVKRVQEWAERHRNDHGIGDIKISNNMDIKVSELNIQLGHPYIYIHQSTNCEHLWCFTSVRLPKPVEHSIFPRYNIIGRFPTKYCVIDNEVLARWAVIDCPRLPQNPMFICTNCLKQFCYSRKTKKPIGDFKLYPYFQLIHSIP